MIIFFIFLLVTLFSFNISSLIAGISALISAIIVLIALTQFIAGWERMYVGKIRIENVHFSRSYVLRSYTKHKKIWIVFDSFKKKFRGAGFRDLPIRVGLIGFFGFLLLYVSFLMILTIADVPQLIIIRSLILFILFVLGLYNFLVSVDRLLSIDSKASENIAKVLNKNRSLRNFAIKKGNFIEITPNFLFERGFVTSFELISKDKIDIKKFQRILIDVSRRIGRLKS